MTTLVIVLLLFVLGLLLLAALLVIRRERQWRRYDELRQAISQRNTVARVSWYRQQADRAMDALTYEALRHMVATVDRHPDASASSPSASSTPE